MKFGYVWIFCFMSPNIVRFSYFNWKITYNKKFQIRKVIYILIDTWFGFKDGRDHNILNFIQGYVLLNIFLMFEFEMRFV